MIKIRFLNYCYFIVNIYIYIHIFKKQAFQLLFLSFFILGILPLCVGLLAELVLVAPFRVPTDETPALFIYQVCKIHLDINITINFKYKLLLKKN